VELTHPGWTLLRPDARDLVRGKSQSRRIDFSGFYQRLFVDNVVLSLAVSLRLVDGGSRDLEAVGVVMRASRDHVLMLTVTNGGDEGADRLVDGELAEVDSAQLEI
jgi:hypothetical protein